MGKGYYGTKLSPHMSKTPEGYLICHSVPINRTGTQNYRAGELELPGDPKRVVQVIRHPEDVFAPETLASFEGKDVTYYHPAEFLKAENYAMYSKGHVTNVRQQGDYTYADLIIKDPHLIEEIQSGKVRQVSCGYTCIYEPVAEGYRQTQIRGNHVAIVPQGRAGAHVAIQDNAPNGEKGRITMSDLMNTLLTALGIPAGEGEPKHQLTTEPTMTDSQKLDRILALLEEKQPKQEVPDRLPDPCTIVGEEHLDSATKTALCKLVEQLRPVVAELQNQEERKRISNAIFDTLGTSNGMGSLLKAAQDSASHGARPNAVSYETACQQAHSAYAARNPHTMKEV